MDKNQELGEVGGRFYSPKLINNADINAFDSALWHHLGLTIRNGFWAGLLSVSRGYLARRFGGVIAPSYRKLEWVCASFAFMTDLPLFSFGRTLKRR
ncbi:MAG: DUF1974 domain-containing protein [Richelia sp.]|nr:DUF1974 domain-containing protein [Richelia sp.]CDN13925.1 oxidoreductase, acyl-CoA dehydrogenase family [Richelia intracellularis]